MCTLSCLDATKPQYKELLDAYTAKHTPVMIRPEMVPQAVDALNYRPHRRESMR